MQTHAARTWLPNRSSGGYSGCAKGEATSQKRLLRFMIRARRLLTATTTLVVVAQETLAMFSLDRRSTSEETKAFSADHFDKTQL